MSIVSRPEAVREVTIEGQTVTLVPNQKPGRDWKRGVDGWSKTLADGTVVSWVHLAAPLSAAPRWTYLIANPRPRKREAPPPVEMRPLSEIPWNEMDWEQKRRAIELGLVTIKPWPRPAESTAAMVEASTQRSKAREDALVRLSADPAYEDWANANRAKDDAHARERRQANEAWIERQRRERTAGRQLDQLERRRAIEYFQRCTGIAVIPRPQGDELPRGAGIIETRSLHVTRVAAKDGSAHEVELRVIRPYTTDDYGSVWMPDAFDASLEVRLPTLAWGHDWKEPLGRATSFVTSSEGPLITFRFDDFDAVPRARQAYAQVKSGTIDDCSVGFSNVTRRPLTQDERVRWPNALEIIERADLDEVSLVLRGAVPGARVESLRAAD